jgi:hypothetical protein
VYLSTSFNRARAFNNMIRWYRSDYIIIKIKPLKYLIMQENPSLRISVGFLYTYIYIFFFSF